MRRLQLSVRARFWGSLLLAAALVACGLAWLALAGGTQGTAASRYGQAVVSGQAQVLMSPFSPQRLVRELAPDHWDRAAAP